jgi:hypothetical protein
MCDLQAPSGRLTRMSRHGRVLAVTVVIFFIPSAIAAAALLGPQAENSIAVPMPPSVPSPTTGDVDADAGRQFPLTAEHRLRRRERRRRSQIRQLSHRQRRRSTTLEPRATIRRRT